jgi:sulfur carrier protein ThiS
MRTRINIAPVLQHVTGNHNSVEVEGNTVHECLESLAQKYPDSRYWFNEKDPIAWIVLNQILINITDLDHPVSENDELNVVMIIGGG